MNPLSVKPEIISLLKSGDFDTFSVPRLRDAYQEATNQTSRPKKVVSQLVKRHLRKLQEDGVLERLDTGRPHPIEYRILDLSKLGHSRAAAEFNEPKQSPTNSTLSESIIRALISKLNKYRTDMLLATGKLEEYEAIVKEQPTLQEVVSEKYAQTRKEYDITLGRAKALESLIALHPSC